VSVHEKSKAELIEEVTLLRQELAVSRAVEAERTQAQTALQESEQRFRKIFDYSNDAIFLIDPEQNLILDANSTACHMLGYSREELLSLNVSTIHPQEMPQLLAFARSVYQQGRGWTNELSCYTKTGAFLPAEISASVVEIDQKSYLLAMVRDTTERKEAEQKIRREAARADALAHSAARLNAQLDLDSVLNAVCEEAAQALDVPAAVVLFFDPEEERFYPVATWGLPPSFVQEYIPNPRSVYLQHPQPYYPQIVVPNLQALPNLVNKELFVRHNIQAIALASLNRKDNLLGALAAYAQDPERTFSEDEISLLRGLADQAALAIRNAQLFEQTRRLAALEERQHLARELHDSVSQSLYGMTLWAGAANDLLEAGEVDATQAYLHQMQEMAQSALAEIRLLIYQLRPPALEEGLASALQERLEAVESRSGLAVALQAEGDLSLPARVEEELYRIAQEALNNIIKHARARTVQIRLVRCDAILLLKISDDGSGFDPSLVRQKGGWGLQGMAERATRLQGTLEIDSRPGCGARITVEVPVHG
jgi:PAS domain S-box-containing protein